MSSIFISLYHKLNNRPIWLWLMMVALILGAGISVYYADLEEDITKIMPTNKAVQKFNEGFLESELSNRVVMHIYNEGEKDNSEQLKIACQLFVDTLLNGENKELIKSITYKVDESVFHSMSKSIMNHLPIFLRESDYIEIEKGIAGNEVEKRIQGSYKALISPASFAFKDNLRRDPMGFSNLALQSLTDFQLDDNFILDDGFILTKDKKHLLFFISPSTHAQESTKNGQLITSISSLQSYVKNKLNTDLFIEHFGGPAISVANATRIKKDVTFTVSIALLSLLILITFYYRDIKIFFFILLPVIAGAAAALILLSQIKTSISIISIGVGSVLIGVTIDYAIHLFTHYKKKQDVPTVLSDIAAPLLISCATTASAFLCLYMVRSEALHDLGLFAALSVLCVGLFSLIILPHVFGQGVNTKAQEHNFIDAIAAYTFHQNKYLVLSFLGMVFGCIFFAFSTQFETDLNQVNYMPEHLLRAEHNINQISAATQRSIYLIGLGESLDDAYEVSENIHNKLDKMKSQGLIESYTSPNSLVPSQAEQLVRIDRWNAFWTSDRKTRLKQEITQASSKLKFKSSAFTSFFKSLDRKYEPISLADIPDISDQLLKDYIVDHDSTAAVMTMVRLASKQKSGLHKEFVNVDRVSIVDKEFIVNEFVEILKADFDKLVLWSLLIVFLILHIVYGRIELAIVAFLPIVCSWIITLGMMNMFGLKFNIVNIIITSFIFGLGIDYSIFILRGLMQKYKYGSNNLPSYKTSILLSSSTTLIGIGVLIFAKHPALQSIAIISIIGIISVLACSFIIEPLVFNFLTYKKENKREFPLTVFNMGKTLWVYALLVIGCILLTIVSVVLNLFFFIPKEFKKTIIHYLIYYFSKFYIKASFLNKVKYIDKEKADFNDPVLVIANHKSLIDTPLLFQLTPKIIIITNDWVNNHPLYKIVCKLADFHSISNGAEHLLERLQERVDAGYSIAIFPEGTRAPDEPLLRFKKGAFYLSEQLQLDILPMMIHGTGPFLRKGSFWGRANPITIKFLDRIHAADDSYGTHYSEMAKNISKSFKIWYKQFDQEVATVDYHGYNLRHNYLYKGPLSEWYMKVKTGLEGNYKIFDNVIPNDAAITDIGCGYGYMSYMLSLRSSSREIIGIDYDEEKINVANNCQLKNDNIKFVSGDAMAVPLTPSDVFLISDMLHYLEPKSQFELLERCLCNLKSHGMIIIRDGDRELKDRHKGTKLTEIFSTKFGFNKTQNELYFISSIELKDWARKNDLDIQPLDQTKFTSNVIFVLKKSQ